MEMLLINSSQFPKEDLSALPPEYQTENEIKAILNDPRLYQLFSSSEEKVVDIRKNGNEYTVVTDGGNEYLVKVIYIPSGIMGPLQFVLEFT